VASKSLSDLRSIVRVRGDYENARRFTDASIDTEIQAAFAELYELIADTNEGYWDTFSTLSTVANQPYVALPADAWRVREIDRLDGSEYVRLRRVEVSDPITLLTSTDEPVGYRLSARGVELYETPDAIYTLRVIYTPQAPTLSAARDWYNGWEEYVVYGALMRLALREERSTGDWERQLAVQRERIVRGASHRSASEPPRLTNHDALDDRKWWR
jgi:hypothetical protein